VDYELFWHAFARRGAGIRTIGPDQSASDNAGVHESFVVGPDLAIQSAQITSLSETCTPDGILDNGEQAVLTVTVKNVGSGSVTPVAIVGSPTPGLRVSDAGLINFPTLTPMKSATASVTISADSLASIARVDLSISATAPGLLVGGVTKSVGFMANFDTALAASANDDVEAPVSAWTATHTSGGDFIDGDFVRLAQTPEQTVWHAEDIDGPSELFLTSPALVVSPSADFTVHFRHAYAFEKGKTKAYDGGVIELSTDGKIWTDVGAQASPGYGGTLEQSDANPLSTRAAFVGKSPGFPALQDATLSFGKTHAGQTVYLRFHAGSDDGVGAAGWSIDDLRFEGIVNTPFSMRVANTCH
jgi:hypothetical protein